MKYTDAFLNFIYNSPSCFHAVKEISCHLENEGWVHLSEGEKWKIEEGGKYFVTRNGSSVIAFEVPKNPMPGLRIISGHSDSPCFKIKENPEVVVENKYVKLNVENYGGMIYSSWFDRPLSVAGRVVVKDGDVLKEKLVNIDRDLLVIPNLAVHMNREINSGYKYNPQKDLQPLLGIIEAKGMFMKAVADACGAEREEDILGHDLFLYPRGCGSVVGAMGEFISAPKLDDLQCVFSSLMGYTSAAEKKHISILGVFDNEETGSGTKQGAASSFLYDTLQRMNGALGRTYEEYLIDLAEGFMISADNAHALHPNYAEKSDPVNRPVIGGGIAVKFNAAQKYCTDGTSAAYFRNLCEEAGVQTQVFNNRSDIAGGSTLGNLSNMFVPMKSVDIGLPQLAMHSAWELSGVSDMEDFIKVSKVFFEG